MLNKHIKEFIFKNFIILIIKNGRTNKKGSFGKEGRAQTLQLKQLMRTMKTLKL
jgi:hypothetical protein